MSVHEFLKSYGTKDDVFCWQLFYDHKNGWEMCNTEYTIMTKNGATSIRQPNLTDLIPYNDPFINRSEVKSAALYAHKRAQVNLHKTDYRANLGEEVDDFIDRLINNKYI